MRLAVGMTALALGVAALAGLGAAALAARLGTAPDPRTITRIDQAGDRVVVVQVQQDVDGAGAAADARRDALRWLLVALGASFVPAAGLAWFVAGRVLRPVHRVAEVAEHVETPGDAPRVGSNGRDDELGRLTDGFDRMLDRLDEREREQRQRLQEVVHELRTPLAIAGMNLELEGAEHVEAARRALERMARIVDDLARHGRLRMDAAGDPVDVVAEVQGLVAEQAGPAAARGVSIEVRARAAVLVPADPVALRTVVGNLLSNAVRLSPFGSEVQVRVGEHAGWAYLAVCDEGPGVAPEDHEAVFERHWRGRHERDRELEGTGGLGLTIARQAAESQGGHLTIDAAEGVGATFTLWLPLTAGARREDVVAADGVHAAAGELRVAP
ncbi:MAG TPA: HAMP domain-containing sensor histidine kinase [Acidimicrobiales bacterium]